MNVAFETDIKNGKDEWLTPPKIINALGEFDLDPYSPVNRPWDTAKNHYTINDNGLSKEWKGTVYCNPPYGRETGKWLKKCSTHNNSIVLIFARTETKMFFNYIWNKADAVLFIKGRIRFYDVTGKQGGSAGAPSVLIAYGNEMVNRLVTCKIEGKFVMINNQTNTNYLVER